MKIYKINQLLRSNDLVQTDNGAFKDMRAGITVGGGDYADEIVALRKAAQDANTETKKKTAEEAIKVFCEQHIIDWFDTNGERIHFVRYARKV